MNTKPNSEQFSTSTLTISLQPGISIEIHAVGRVSRRTRRTVLLTLFRSIKKDLKFLRGASLIHRDSDRFRQYFDSLKNVSEYQALGVDSGTQQLGYQIRMIRTSLGMSQDRLAALVGISPSMLSRLEQGKIVLRANKWARLSRLLENLYNQQDREDDDSGTSGSSGSDGNGGPSNGGVVLAMSDYRRPRQAEKLEEVWMH